MDKSQLFGVQHDARRGETDQFLEAPVLALPVSDIAHERITEKLEVDTNLMRAPCVQCRLDQCCRTQPLKHPVRRSRFAAGFVPDGHAFAVGGMTGNCSADFALVPLHFPADNRVVDLPHFATGEL